MNTIQQVAAFCILLVQGPGREVFSARDPETIRAVFRARHLLHLEVGGLDYTPELIELQCLVQPYVRDGVIPPYERMSACGFAGEFMHWFWTTVTEVGEDAYFSKPSGEYAIKFAAGRGRDAINEGWLIAFIDSQLHHMYQNTLRNRRSVAAVLGSKPSTGPVFQYLLHFKKNVE